MSFFFIVFLKYPNIAVAINIAIIFDYQYISVFDGIDPAIANWPISPTANLVFTMIFHTDFTN